MSFLDEILNQAERVPIRPTLPFRTSLPFGIGPVRPGVNLLELGQRAEQPARSFLNAVRDPALSVARHTPILPSVPFVPNSVNAYITSMLGDVGRTAWKGAKIAGNAVQDVVQGTPPAETPTDRTTAWDTEAQYAVMRNLTTADRTVPFQNATISSQVTDKTVEIVLKYLAKEGVEISPEVAQGFREGADEAIRLWYNGSMQDEQVIDISEYYKFLTDAVIYAQEASLAETADTTTDTVPAEGITSTEAAFNTSNQTTQSTPPQTAPAGDFSFMEASSPEELVPDADMMTWGGSHWGPDKTALYANQEYYNAYIGWLQTIAQPTWSKTPEAFNRYYEEKMKRTQGGT